MAKTLRKSKDARTSAFVYKKRSADALKKRAEQTGGRFDSPWKQSFDVWRPKVGDNLIRFLPPTWDDHEHYGLEVWVHRFIGPDSSTYLCRKKMLSKPCALCDAAKEAKDAGEQEEAKALGNVKVVLSWIIDRDADQPTPLLYPMSWTMDRDIAALCYNKRTGNILLIDHPDEGYDVTIKRTGQGIKTRYFGLAIDRDPSPIDDDEKIQDDVIAYITENPLPSVLQYYDNEHLENVLSGTVEEKDKDLDEEEEDDPKPKRRRAKSEPDEEEEEDDPAPRRRRRAEPDEEEDEDEAPPPRRRRAKPEPEEEEEEDEDPKPRRRRAKAEPEEEEEDDEPQIRRRPESRRAPDDDPEEEEEDETPPRRRRAKPEPEEEEEEDEPAPRRRRRVEPEDEEEEEDEDPKPKRRRRVDPEDEEEEEDEPEEEEEEDETPRRRRRR